MNILRRASLARLLLICGLLVAIGASATAIASALDAGPLPPSKPLADAVHEALAGPAPEGLSADVQYTNNLLEGANLASGGGEASQLNQSPLLSGAKGRLWIAKDGRVRLELQAEKGDTQILYDGHTLSIYDASTNTLYRYAVPQHEGGTTGESGATGDSGVTGASGATGDSGSGSSGRQAPSVAKIEEAIAHAGEHADVSGATPGNVAGRPAYTVRISPKETGSLIGGAELSFDAGNGVPLRGAVYSSSTPAPVIELTATKVSYAPVEDSVFEFTPPPNAKVQELGEQGSGSGAATPGGGASGEAEHPTVTTHGQGIGAIVELETSAKGGGSALPEGLPQVKIGSATATELSTALGTLLTFERNGVSYVFAGALPAKSVEELARGL